MSNINVIIGTNHNLPMDKKLSADRDKTLKDLKGSIINEVVLIKDDAIVAILFFVDEIRSNAHYTLSLFKKLGIKTYILTGDNEENTARVCDYLHLDKHYSNLKPLDKLNRLKEIQAQDPNSHVAYVGDGINDIAALEQADLSIAMGSGSQAAIGVADIILIDEDIKTIYNALMLTRSTKKMIWLNLLWSFAYNVITVCLAAIAILPAVLGAILMGLSDLNLLVNTLVFKLKKNRDIKIPSDCEQH